MLLFNKGFVVSVVGVFASRCGFKVGFMVICIVLGLVFLFFGFTELGMVGSGFICRVIYSISFIVKVGVFIFTRESATQFRILVLSTCLYYLCLLGVHSLLEGVWLPYSV